MKRKLLLGLVGGMIATFSILSVNTSLSNTDDISLKNISVMARADAEYLPNDPCPFTGNGCLGRDDMYFPFKQGY